MDIQKISTDKLNPVEYNPRKNLAPCDKEYDKLKRSITEFGFVEPVIWNAKTGNVVGGHQRLKVITDLGHCYGKFTIPYCHDRASYNVGQNAQFEMSIQAEQAQTLVAKGPNAVSQTPEYTVRCLTPTECALLQGFPADWCANLETSEPTDEDIAFWAEVFETHRKIVGTLEKPQSDYKVAEKSL